MGAYRHVLAAIGPAGAAAVGTAACEPGTGGLSTMVVSCTTDTTGTRALERAGVDERWLSCTSTLNSTTTASPSPPSVATVDCEGETGDGTEITLTGKVTQEVGGRCVRGDLTAKAGTRTAFRADVLGDCAAPVRPPAGTPPPDTAHPAPRSPSP
ncbi:hypothetical protein [Streptomyces sp. NPDC002133]|uniref:hypothetical protein n=1 Tax=Streptomyces sp. NPDC002133 TaxID=3154409 RepID=UPI00331AF852